jgi:ATP-binding cassette subfamily B protein
LLNSVTHNAVWIGTETILILVNQAMQQGTFSVGDFALFVYYLDWVTGASEFIGYFLARFKQPAVSFDSLLELLSGNTQADLVAHSSLPMEGELPPVQPTGAAGGCCSHVCTGRRPNGV